MSSSTGVCVVLRVKKCGVEIERKSDSWPTSAHYKTRYLLQSHSSELFSKLHVSSVVIGAVQHWECQKAQRRICTRKSVKILKYSFWFSSSFHKKILLHHSEQPRSPLILILFLFLILLHLQWSFPWDLRSFKFLGKLIGSCEDPLSLQSFAVTFQNTASLAFLVISRVLTV